jgi:hypothetical protein
MQSQPQTPQQQRQAYLDSVMKTFADAPDKLSASERQLAEKCARGDQRVGALFNEISNLKNQIENSQARLRNLELTVEREQGAVNGFVELLVEGKFGRMEGGPVEAPKKAAKPAAKGSSKKAAKGAQEAAEEAA